MLKEWSLSRRNFTHGCEVIPMTTRKKSPQTCNSVILKPQSSVGGLIASCFISYSERKTKLFTCWRPAGVQLRVRSQNAGSSGNARTHCFRHLAHFPEQHLGRNPSWCWIYLVNRLHMGVSSSRADTWTGVLSLPLGNIQ